jgi:hypothetical protein
MYFTTLPVHRSNYVPCPAYFSLLLQTCLPCVAAVCPIRTTSSPPLTTNFSFANPFYPFQHFYSYHPSPKDIHKFITQRDVTTPHYNRSPIQLPYIAGVLKGVGVDCFISTKWPINIPTPYHQPLLPFPHVTPFTPGVITRSGAYIFT